jgi:hypothetical protein
MITETSNEVAEISFMHVSVGAESKYLYLESYLSTFLITFTHTQNPHVPVLVQVQVQSIWNSSTNPSTFS